MKKLYVSLILCVLCNVTFGQKEAELFKFKQFKNSGLAKTELKEKFSSTDFSAIWTQTENQNVYGFIGDNYQRISIKLISVSKSKTSPNTYDVYGKSMVKNNIGEFRGTINISAIQKFKITSFGVDDEWKDKGLKGQFVIIGDYEFFEDKTQRYSGVFKGSFRTDFYLDKNSKVNYDNIGNYSDSYSNNQFVGIWTSYSNNLAKRCNWGDFRITNSGDLDIGAGDFSPNSKYQKNGWKNTAVKRSWWK